MNIKYVLSKFQGVKRIGRNRYQALCPVHDDHTPSLSITEEHDKILIYCHTRCPIETILKRAGLKWSDLFGNDNSRRPPRQDESKGLTLEMYAVAKQLPMDFLESLGMKTVKKWGKNAVEIPYKTSDGTMAAKQFRFSMSGPDRFRWEKGSKQCLYGLERIKKDVDHCILVEGVSDVHSLWFHGFNAIGLPSATGWDDTAIAVVSSRYDKIYVMIEPDDGGRSVLSNPLHLNS